MPGRAQKEVREYCKYVKETSWTGELWGGSRGIFKPKRGEGIWCRVGREWEGGEKDNQECEERDASDGEEEMESEHWEGLGGVEESLGR